MVTGTRTVPASTALLGAVNVALPWSKLCYAQLNSFTAPDAGFLVKPKIPVLPEIIVCLGTRAPGKLPNPNGNFTQMTKNRVVGSFLYISAFLIPRMSFTIHLPSVPLLTLTRQPLNRLKRTWWQRDKN